MKEIDDQYKEEVAHLHIEFQLERSTLRKKHREVSDGSYVLTKTVFFGL